MVNFSLAKPWTMYPVSSVATLNFGDSDQQFALLLLWQPRHPPTRVIACALNKTAGIHVVQSATCRHEVAMIYSVDVCQFTADSVPHGSFLSIFGQV